MNKTYEWTSTRHTNTSNLFSKKNILFCKELCCAGSVDVIGAESGFNIQKSNSSFVLCINTLEKDMDLSVLSHPSTCRINSSFLALGDSQSKVGTALNSKRWRQQREIIPISSPSTHSNSCQIIKKKEYIEIYIPYALKR